LQNEFLNGIELPDQLFTTERSERRQEGKS
jgi:hypothetical protein